MATTQHGVVWEFDAVGEGDDIDGKFYVRYIQFNTGTEGGAMEVTNGNGGITLTGSIVMAVNDREFIFINDYVDELYVSALPTGAQVLVKPGKR